MRLSGALRVGIGAVCGCLMVVGCTAGAPSGPAPHGRTSQAAAPTRPGGTVSATSTATRAPSGPSTTGSTLRASSEADPGLAAAAGTRAENRRPGNADWRVPGWRTAGPRELAGYADRVSVLPGQPFRLFVTATAPSFTVRAFRLGWYGGAQARLVWQSGHLPGHRQPAPTVGPGHLVTTSWTPSVRVTTAGWPAGAYLLLLTDIRGRAKYVPLTVRSAATRGRLVIVNAVATYQAYNAWGGWSLYHGPDGGFATRASMVSYDRPYDDNGARILTRYEQGTISQAERLGLPLAYLTSVDLDTDPGVLAGARGVVSLGHDEYWTTAMRAAVTRARDSGTNLAFLGANAVYWRVRFAARGAVPDRVLVGYKSAAADPMHGPSTTTMWRSAPFPDPENSLVGSLYECFPANGALVVRDPGFFLFAGTGARAGSAYPGLIGPEINRAYPIGGTPAGLQVVAHSPVRCGPTGSTASDVTYYTTASGAGVLAVGTMGWDKAVRGASPGGGPPAATSAFARRVTVNLLTVMAAGPMGPTHPSRSDLAALHEPTTTRTGTGGPVAR